MNKLNVRNIAATAALAATLVSQDDAEVVRSLREDFGAAGLVGAAESCTCASATA